MYYSLELYLKINRGVSLQTLKDYNVSVESEVRFFIFDSKNDHLIYGDKDFEEYHWDQSKYNKVRVGDYFLYRRPQKASEVKNQFYIYGMGKVSSILNSEYENVGESRKRRKPVYAVVSEGYCFIDPILQSDLENFEWTFKKRGETWEHFFQQYGMNEINAQDFFGLLKLAGIQKSESTSLALPSKLHQQILDYSVGDKFAEQKIRGSEHQKFAQQVKLNYQYKCAITGISTKACLVASHIIPWSVDITQRRNPKNGICLSALLDRAFDAGYITFDQQLRLQVAHKSKTDPSLYKYLQQFQGKKLNIGRQNQPEEQFLNWHRMNRFLDNIKKKSA